MEKGKNSRHRNRERENSKPNQISMQQMQKGVEYNKEDEIIIPQRGLEPAQPPPEEFYTLRH